MNKSVDEPYIGIDDAATFLDIRPVTLRSWLKSKPDLPAHRVGKLWKFKKTELDQWVKSGKSSE